MKKLLSNLKECIFGKEKELSDEEYKKIKETNYAIKVLRVILDYNIYKYFVKANLDDDFVGIVQLEDIDISDDKRLMNFLEEWFNTHASFKFYDYTFTPVEVIYDFHGKVSFNYNEKSWRGSDGIKILDVDKSKKFLKRARREEMEEIEDPENAVNAPLPNYITTDEDNTK